ncbi:CRP/FNR family transcriptional regulator [Bacillus ectoiniformans]|uniref:Crp/Fnr family transcriptional regulator n=1 Tax=Bacillus ectoiniformans TaxID=1494429 RepID=UPI001EF7635E|nr:Crp/Fnr family transcriptional regulator [Bacillus ectoiniformans]MBM7649060.1 CRP/FNR family transcriptional regulator [Bacillus ectoiniformans]
MINSRRKSDIDLISEDLRNLLLTIGTPKKTEKGAFLFQEGMDASELYLVKSGLVQISKLTAEGKELNLRICKKDDIVGELILFSEDAKYMLSAMVLSEGEVLVLNKEVLEKELMKNNQLTYEFIKWISSHLRAVQSKIIDLVLHGKKGALFSTLIRFSNSYGVQTKDGILIDIHLTNQELAKFCSATRESVNRMLSELRKNKIIATDESGKITILDIDYLKCSIGCDTCQIDECHID